MSLSAAVLQELHRLHGQLSDLRSRLERGPKQIAVAEAHVATANEVLGAAKEAVKRSRISADQKELQLRECENRILDVRDKLNSCSTNREYQAFLEQIAADEQANSVLADEILELFEKINELQGVVETRQIERQKLEHELEVVRQRVEESRAAIEADVSRLSADLEKAETQLPADFLNDYRRLVNARGAEALAPLDGGCCGGCYQTVTPQTVNELMMSRLVICKACGCVLYFPPEDHPK